MKTLSVNIIGGLLVGSLLVSGSLGVGTGANAVAFPQQAEEPVTGPTMTPPVDDAPVDGEAPVGVPGGEPVVPDEVVPDVPLDNEGEISVDVPIDDSLGGSGEMVEEIDEPGEPEVPIIVGVVPSIGGSVKAGSTVTAKTGVWTPAETQFKYQWLLDGKNIKNATQATYKIVTGDRGKKLTVKVTGVLEGAESVVLVSKPLTVPKVLTATTPVIGGTSKLNSSLSVKTTGWTSGTSFTYQWLSNGKPISGVRAQKAAFKITSAEWCQTLTVQVTGKKTAHEARTVTSKAHANAGCPQAGYHRIYVGERVDSGKQIASTNWKHAARMATDGNAYLYNHGRARWAAPAATRGAQLFLNPTGNLVIMKGGVVKWQSKTSGKSVSYAAIDASGELGLYTSAGKRVWTASGNNAYRWNNWGVPNLNQNDGRWAGATVGYYRFGPVACVPTAFAMAAQSYGVNVNPYQVGVIMNRYGDFNQGVAGAGGRSIKVAAAQYGLKATPLTSQDAITKALKNNQPVIGLVSGPYSITSPGSTHAIVLDGVHGGNKTTVHNPWGGYTASYSISTLWAYQSWDALDRNAGAVFWAIG